MNGRQLTNISKSISYLLRHGARKENIKIDESGFVQLADLLDWLNKTQNNNEYVTEDHVMNIVTSDAKGRYYVNIQDDVTYIRANQGHSLKVESLELKEITPDNITNYLMVMHGTYQKFESNIRQYGLNPMSRQHVHMINLTDSDCFKLMRHDVDMFVIVDIKQAINDGYKFYESTNNVILSKGKDGYIPSKYLTFLHKSKSPCTGVIVIGTDVEGQVYLSMVKTPKNHWSFPKGKKEKGENCLQTGLRELWEETGITSNDITFCELPVYKEYSDNGNLSVCYYVARYINIIEPKYLKLLPNDPDELTEARWIRYDTVINWEGSDKNGYLRNRRIQIAKQIPENVLNI
jgi:2'-phosphotransferase